jgi:hypothetical protein
MSTFEENKEQFERKLQEVLDYDEEGNKSLAQRELETLKEQCERYKREFESYCKTPGGLMDFRRRMENTYDEFCAEVGTPDEGSWDQGMFLSVKSKMDTCITNLKQMEKLYGHGPDVTLQISNSLAKLKSFL